MTGKLLERKQNWKHYCKKPGGLKQLVKRIGPGSIWECDCGIQYMAVEVRTGHTPVAWYDMGQLERMSEQFKTKQEQNVE